MQGADQRVEASVLKEARERCHKTRDAFYECVGSSSAEFTLQNPVPAACKVQRKAYEASCKASWVRHFDIQHDKELRYLKTLQANIRASAQAAAGSLQGEPQQ